MPNITRVPIDIQNGFDIIQATRFLNLNFVLTKTGANFSFDITVPTLPVTFIKDNFEDAITTNTHLENLGGITFTITKTELGDFEFDVTGADA